MKLIKTLLLLFFFPTFVHFSYSQSVDEIIEKNIEALGGKDKLNTINTMKITGQLNNMGIDAHMNMIIKRPDKVRVEAIVFDKSVITAYDGIIAWTINPFIGKEEPDTMTSDELKNMKKLANISELVDYKEKGYIAEYICEDDVEGTKAYKVKLIDEYRDTAVLFFDIKNFLMIKKISKRIVQGNEINIETIYSDYRPVEGVMFPFLLDSQSDGLYLQKITIEKIEINIPVEDKIFKIPENNK